MRFTSYGTSGHAASAPSWSRAIAGKALWRCAVGLALGLGAGAAAQAQYSLISSSVTNAQNGSAVWGDYNNDGKLDVLFSGSTTAGGTGPFADVYDNATGFSGIGAFPVGYGSGTGAGTGRNRAAWGDYDNDGDLDVVLTGFDGTSPSVTLYNNSGGTFTAVTISPVAFIGLYNTSVAWADFDNDGDLDLFVSGFQNGGAPYSTVYRNDGPGTGSTWKFTDITSCITKLGDGDGAWADYDNDGDMDLVVTGDDGGGTPVSVLYENMAGVFMPNTAGITLLDLRASSVAWGDYDNDGDLDLAMTGFDAGGNRQFRLYRNNGGTSFTAVASPGITAVSDGSLAWGDANNDGKLDLLVTGNDGSAPVAVVYLGNGLGSFTPLAGSGLTGVVYGQGSWGDFDNDGKIDIALTGNDGTNPFSGIYRSRTSKADAVPPAPTNLSVAVYWKTLVARWSPPATAGTTPLSGLSYNLEVTDVTTGSIVEPSEADLATGYRRVPALGNADEDLSWTITNLTPGHTYDVCVQAVDHAWLGSRFRCTQATLPNDGPDVMIGDCSSDVGAEPNGACSAFYLSPDIWIRNANDGGTTYQSPIGGTTNYIYVRLTNLSGTYAATGLVQVFFAKASTGLGWSYDWVDNYIGGLVYGDYIGSASASVAAGGTQTVVIPWTSTPTPSYYSDPDAHHFCLVARFTGPGDPITFGEISSHPTNVQNNNNLAWRNTSIVDMPTPSPVTAPIEVANPTDAGTVVDLHMTVENAENSFLDHNGTIAVDLGADGWAAWMNNGGNGNGVQPLNDDADNTSLAVTAEDATIQGIPIEARQRLTMHVTFDAPYDQQFAGHQFSWRMEEQTSDDSHTLLGGEGYDITMPRSQGQNKPALTGNAADAAREYKLDARPNPTSGSTTISYTLPSSGTVELAIYDATGNLVRTLTGAAEQAAGSHVVEWNGLSQSGTQVPNGTYFYRLQVGQQSVEGQIKIVR